MQDRAQAELAEAGQQLDRPYWVFRQHEACQQFGFIYLNEDEPDPTLYHCLPAYVADGHSLLEVLPVHLQPFSRFIKVCVEHGLLDDSYSAKGPRKDK